MNLIKNLLIIAVLAAVGYGVYISLAQNNVDSGPPPGVADGWPSVPKVELPGAKSSTPPGGPLALRGSRAPSAGPANFGMGGTALPSPPPPGAGLNAAPAGIAANATSVTPYPSSTAPPTASSSPPAAVPSSPLASLGAPTSPPGVSAASPYEPTAPPLGQSPPSNMLGGLAPPQTSPATSGVATAPNPADGLLQSKFAAFMDAVRKKLDEGKLADAHLALSALYGNPDLPADQAKQINHLLDQLAGTVIYSRKHYLEPPYVTQPGDTLEKVAQKYSVPWQLLGRINGLMPPSAANTNNATKDQPLPVGMELKVVRGPFEAVVHLDRHELTLMVRNRYAGRFPIGVGRDQPSLDGSYTIRDKRPNPPYHGPDGASAGPGDPRNPLGDAWIGLTDRIGIHGTSDPRGIGRNDNRGAICVGKHDLQDLYGILSVGSRVTIVR